MIETFRNAWKVPELRRKLLFTFFIIVIYRIGGTVPVPYLDKEFDLALIGTKGKWYDHKVVVETPAK